MSYQYNSAALDSDAAKAIESWTAHADLKIGELSLQTVKTCRDEFLAADNAVEAKRTELSRLIGVRDDKAVELNDLVRRARSGFRCVFGSDSPEYKQIGGTRTSERKKRRRDASNPEGPVVPAMPSAPLLQLAS